MDGCLDDFLTRLYSTGSAQQSWDEALLFLKILGFDLAMYGYSCGLPDQGLEVATFSNFPSHYQERYRKERYHLEDPVVRHCIDHVSARLIGPNSLPYWPDQGRVLTPVQRRIVDDAAACGMKVGVVFPLRSPGNNPLAGISLSNDMGLAEFERFLPERLPLVHLTAVHAHIRIQMQIGTEGTTSISLTARERECLLWTSHGKPSKETARRLGISFRTVEYHIANAMAKLGATTRSHAVARAIALGLLNS
jgi:DNA-binding CsgD family transcriptional regulator